MNRPALFAALGVAGSILAGCGEETRTDAGNVEVIATTGQGNNAGETTIRAEMNGMRANIDFDGGDVRVGDNGVSVNVGGTGIDAKVRANENGSFSITANSQ